MTRRLFVGKPTIKSIMQRTRSKSWPGKNDIVPKTLTFSNHVVKPSMKTTRKLGNLDNFITFFAHTIDKAGTAGSKS